MTDAIMRSNQVTHYLRRIAAVLLAIAAFMFVCEWVASRYLPFYRTRNWSTAEKRESMVRGNVIVDGLDKFNRQNGHYPETLDELVPRYLDLIPLPTAGDRRWRYYLTPDRFYLKFATEDEYPSVHFNSKDRDWYEDH